ncbi:hypothetical protein KKA87_05390 [bacterium]|nr:hypothetical protein [bacterium]MBU1994774.1 hypothetical protein [bacterium]
MGLFDIFKTNESNISSKKPSLPDCPPEIIEREKKDIINRFIKGEEANNFPSNVLLKKDERLIIDIPNIILAEEKTTKVGGGYLGFSIRIMKGVSVRPGVFTGSKETKVAQIDKGSFTLTNKRIIFSGDRQTRNFNLSSINSLLPTDNGIGINRNGKTKTEYYLGTQNVNLSFIIEPDEGVTFAPTKIEWDLEGYNIQEIIQRLIQED